MTLRRREGTVVERGSTRLDSVENSLWKRLMTRRKTVYVVMMMMMTINLYKVVSYHFLSVT